MVVGIGNLALSAQTLNHSGLGCDPATHDGVCVNIMFKVFSDAPGSIQRTTGVPHLQDTAPPWDPTVGLCLGS